MKDFNTSDTDFLYVNPDNPPYPRPRPSFLFIRVPVMSVVDGFTVFNNRLDSSIFSNSLHRSLSYFHLFHLDRDRSSVKSNRYTMNTSN